MDNQGRNIQRATVKELACAYKVDRKTFRRWLQPCMHQIGMRSGYYFSVKQVEKIFELLGDPLKRESAVNNIISKDNELVSKTNYDPIANLQDQLKMLERMKEVLSKKLFEARKAYEDQRCGQ